jgi:murein DD-endopeptidase MepM/ murein hydrolase activator NlpD
VRQGDNLALLFKRAGLGSRTVHEVIHSSPEAKQLARLNPGQELALLYSDSGELEGLRLNKNRLHRLELHRTDSGYDFRDIHRQPDILYAFATGIIDSSLFESAQQAGLNDKLTMELAGIFGWDVDFVLEIRRGDSFALVYEELFLDGEKIGNGDIVAAEFTNRGNTFAAVRYTRANGDHHYFTPEGLSMRKEFLRSPVDFARISSHFNLRRKHPILHTIRAHKGTDYAAARGTPVRATGDGRVIHAGRKGGFGRTVVIQHGQTYETLYAHLDKYGRGIKSGSRVRQGQIIGYVGSSGLATGPHLHYEFHVNGAVRNPVTVKLPKAQPIAFEEKARFLAQTRKYLVQLASYTNKPIPTQLALAEEN